MDISPSSGMTMGLLLSRRKKYEPLSPAKEREFKREVSFIFLNL